MVIRVEKEKFRNEHLSDAERGEDDVGGEGVTVKA